ncbi:MAG: MFS transporter, partial [Clostridia bacterium]|nr:MFS transporter [Clostridia bacterium]
INATMQSVVQFGAPAAAAVVLTMSTLRAALMIDIFTAVIGIGVFSSILLPKQEKPQEMTSVLKDIGVGIRYAHSCMAVRKTLVIYSLFVFLTVPAGYLSGLLVSRNYGDTYWHLTAVELFGFGGMMLGGLFMSIWGGFKSRRLTLAAGLGLFGSMAIGMGVSRYFILYLVFMALYGIALTAVQTTLTTMLQENSEASMQGRVFGLMSSLYSSCYPIGMAVFGPLADTIPLQWIMVISGIALITVAYTAYCDRYLKFNQQ